MANVRVLVTGGAGFIGSNLVQHLAGEGHEVVVLDDLSSGYPENLVGTDVRFIKGDVRDEKTVQVAAEGCELFYHLAAAVGNKRSIDSPVDDGAVNVMGTLNVLQAARQNGAKKVLFSSSAGIFGELKHIPIAEDHPCEPDSPYGASKLGAEKECLAFSKVYGLECVSLRYFNVYGPRQRFDAYGNVIPIFVFRMLRGQPITIYGDGGQTRDFVNVRDVVQANYRGSLSPGTWGAFNIGSGTRISICCLVEMLAEICGKRTNIEYGPPRPGDVRDSLADVSKATREFGFVPSVSLEYGLREYVDWARTEVALR